MYDISKKIISHLGRGNDIKEYTIWDELGCLQRGPKHPR
jgi:hypothetical protein